MKKTRFIAIMLIICFAFMSIPVGANDQNEKEHVYTYEELASLYYKEAKDSSAQAANELVPINKTVNASKGTTAYYIIENADGYMLSNPTGANFSRTRYSAGNSNSHIYQKWNFTEVSSGVYTVYSYSNSTLCLTVNPSTKKLRSALIPQAPIIKNGKCIIHRAVTLLNVFLPIQA